MEQQKQQYIRPFLKWAGGKYRLLPILLKEFDNQETLVEPFVGAGAVFLNTNYQEYILADINKDLINLYKIIQQDVTSYIQEANKLFTAHSNQAEFYYKKRDEFNATNDIFRKSLLFLYLNRHGYNGLCRYNLSNKFNVPFGKYVKPYFPKEELMYFAKKAKLAKFIHIDFQKLFQQITENSLVYCDPPYAPIIEQNTNFVTYNKKGFTLQEQETLATLAEKFSAKKKIKILISNHDTKYTRKIYRAAKIKSFKVQRSINHKGNQRVKVKELLAIYDIQQN